MSLKNKGKYAMNLTEFINITLGKYVDAIGNVDNKNDGPYDAQCASLARRWLVVGFGQEDKPYGHGKSFANTPKGSIVKNPKLGDLVVWETGEYGHVAIYIGSNNGKPTVLEQQSGVIKTQKRTLTTDKGYVFFRPKQMLDIKVDMTPKKGWYTTTGVLYIREGAGTGFNVKKVRHITSDAKIKVVDTVLNSQARLRKGVKVYVSEVKDTGKNEKYRYWGKIPSGWVSMSYLKEV
jgi:hypothetical protein